MFVLGPAWVEPVRGLTRERPWRRSRLVDALLWRRRGGRSGGWSRGRRCRTTGVPLLGRGLDAASRLSLTTDRRLCLGAPFLTLGGLRGLNGARLFTSDRRRRLGAALHLTLG